MSKRIKRNLPLLKALTSLKPAERRSFLCQGPDDLILTLCEIALNVLKGNIPLTSAQYSRLRKEKKIIKLFADPKGPMKRKRKVLTQSGGFLLPLLGAAIPFLTSLFSRRQ